MREINNTTAQACVPRTVSLDGWDINPPALYSAQCRHFLTNFLTFFSISPQTKHALSRSIVTSTTQWPAYLMWPHSNSHCCRSTASSGIQSTRWLRCSARCTRLSSHSAKPNAAGISFASRSTVVCSTVRPYNMASCTHINKIQLVYLAPSSSLRKYAVALSTLAPSISACIPAEHYHGDQGLPL